MKKLFSTLALALTLASPLTTIAATTASNILPLLLRDFRLHDYDKAIVASLGYDSGSVIYFPEMGSISDNEISIRHQYEPLGCFPFYFMKDGKVAELGLNCRSFFCVGYQKGPKQCKDRHGSMYGGVVEISQRLATPLTSNARIPFTSFPETQRTPEMKRVIDELAAIRCTPFYTMHFDIIVGEGYDCEQVGKYPNYSPKTSCLNDWQTTNGMQCSVAFREDEHARRLAALQVNANMSVSSSSSSQTAVAGVHDESDAVDREKPRASSGADVQITMPSAPLFSDIEEGKYGFTAITTLAIQGVITGYLDGTFRPMMTVSRGELTKLLLAGLHASELQDETECFPDVSNQWFSAPVCAAKRLGWVQGYTDGSFRPHRSISMAEGITLITRSLPQMDTSSVVLPEGVAEDAWYAAAVRTAIAAGILREPIFEPHRELTRADAAVWIYRAGNVQ